MWERRFFREPIFSPSDPDTEAAAPAECAFLWRALKLKKGSRVLDICCGTGRHALRLARKGALVTGIDRTPAYLAKARRDARGLKNLDLRRGDMRAFPFEGEFDAAYNVWTSFGYFERPGEDLKALKAAARALKPGGLFLLDIMDFAAFKKTFMPRRWHQRPDGAYQLEEAELRGGADPALLSSWTIVPPKGRPQKVDLFVRGYDEARLRAFMRRAGLEPLRRWSTLEGGRSGPRLVLLASRA